VNVGDNYRTIVVKKFGQLLETPNESVCTRLKL